ncbi:MAG: riboflavin synthase [Acidimicrobiales bacterium]
MFTGIVEELGSVRSIQAQGDGALVVIDAATVLGDVELGASIAVNGCCLTVVAFDADSWTADAVPATLARTNIGGLEPGDQVNLERPLSADGRFGGHIVQGHVDGVTSVTAVDDLDDGSRLIRLALPAGLGHYIVEKGSVALDGVSLTVAAVDHDSFAIALIPHTLAHTTFGHRAVGSKVNVETDVLAKHVERLLASAQPQETP